MTRVQVVYIQFAVALDRSGAAVQEE